jgi:hypothetical protein
LLGSGIFFDCNFESSNETDSLVVNSTTEWHKNQSCKSVNERQGDKQPHPGLVLSWRDGKKLNQEPKRHDNYQTQQEIDDGGCLCRLPGRDIDYSLLHVTPPLKCKLRRNQAMLAGGNPMPNARDQRRRAVGAPLALVASGVTTSAERCIA